MSRRRPPVFSEEDGTLRRALAWAAVGELSCRIAHDSNNLLAAVLGQAELGMISEDPARMKTGLEAILRGARELKAVNERLLGFSRTIESTPRNTNLGEVFQEVFRVLERAFSKAGVDVQIRSMSALPATWCDPGGAMQTLLFGLRLALESLSAVGGGTAFLEGREERGEIVLGVRIASPGKVLSVPDGAGALTVSLASALLREQGGSFEVTRGDEGCLIECRFPVRRSPRPVSGPCAPAPEIPPFARGSEPLPSISVLVVEDEEPIRDLVKEVLESAGCRVEAVEDGETAIDRFRRGSHGIVMTDIALPGIDGVSLLRRMRAIDPTVLLVVLTGRTTEDAANEAREAGATIVLAKPFELSDLIGIVKTVRDRADAGGAQDAERVPGLLMR